MSENFETNQQGICRLPEKPDWAEVLCSAPAAGKRPEPAGQDGSHIHSSPFGGRTDAPKDPVLPTFEFPSQPQPVSPPWPTRPEAAPPQKEPAPKPARTNFPPTVYVDIGHCTSKDGGHVDGGFESDSYNECKINTGVGRRLIADLKQSGFRVVPTWDPDSPPALVSKEQDLQRRVNVVNNDIARHGGDSVYVSIHHDQDSSGKSGQCAYVAEPKMSEARPLAASIQNSAWHVRQRGGGLCINSDTTTHNGKLVGLRGVNATGVLIEAANVSNPNDKAYMPRPEFQELEAAQIAKGVMNYFRLKAAISGPDNR